MRRACRRNKKHNNNDQALCQGLAAINSPWQALECDGGDTDEGLPRRRLSSRGGFDDVVGWRRRRRDIVANIDVA
jgi:hypothetical protein